MAKITIAELDLNVQALIASTSEVKKRIDDLKKQQAELTKSGETSSKAFVDNAAALRALGAEYTAGLRGITETNKALTEQANREQLLTMAIETQVSSISEARAQNALLNRLRNDSNVLSQQGQLDLNRLNEALDRNNEFIRNNSDALTRQKMNIGGYADGIREALGNINPLNGGIAGFTQRSQEAGGAGVLLRTSLAGATTGFLGLIKASLAFIATPIGAVLAAIVLAFSLVKNAMNRSEESTNKIAKVFSIFSGITNKLLKALEPLGEFIVDVIVAGFELAAKAAEQAVDVISGSLAFLGFDDAAKSVNGFKEEIKGAVKDSAALADAEAELEKQQRKSQITQLEYQKNAEKLRQIRDNENLTIAERIKANEDLGVVLKNQLKDELAIAQQALIVANLRIASEGQTKEALDAQAAALTSIADISERITGQESEQLQNRVALQKEAADKQKEIADKARERAKEATDAAIAESKTQLDLFIAQQGIRAKSLEEEVKLAEQVRDKKLKILDQELKAKKLTQSEFDLQALTTQQDFLKKQADAAVDLADKELKKFIDNNKSKIDANKFLSDELVAQEIQRLNNIAEEEAKAQTERLVQGTINQQQYNDAIAAIDAKFEEDKKIIKDQKIAADLEKKIIDIENEKVAKQTGFEEDLGNRQMQLDSEREQEIKNAFKSGADIETIKKKFANQQKILDADIVAFKISQTAESLSALRGFVKEESFIGKSLALGEVFINTQQQAAKLFGLASYYAGLVALNPAFAGAAINAKIQGGIVIAQGVAQSAKIAGYKFEEGGIQEIGGKRHSAGGTKFYGEDGTTFEAESGEGIGVLNRGAFAAFMDFNNRFSSGGKSTPNFMAGGGIITQGVTSSTPGLNVNDLLTAIQSMPAPVVTVEDINAKTSEVIRVEQGANF